MEQYLRRLASGLAERGHEVKVLAERIDPGPIRPEIDALYRRQSWKPFRDGAVSVEPLRVSLARRPALAPLLLRRSQRIKRGHSTVFLGKLYAATVGPVIAQASVGAEVIHAWGGNVLACATARAAELLRRPCVMTPQAHAGQWDDDPTSAYAYARADRIVASIEADANLYARLGVHPERIVISPPCVPPPAAGDPDSVRRKIAPRRHLVLFLGVRRPHKGVDLLIEAARLVCAKRSDVVFAFAGPGPPLGEYGLGKGVLDLATVDEVQKSAWLQAADLLCLPSSNESFGLVVGEAWAAGTPALVSDIPLLKQLVEKGGGGRAVRRAPADIADGVLDLLDAPDELRRLGEAGRAYWQRELTVDAAVRRHEAFYEELVNRGSG